MKKFLITTLAGAVAIGAGLTASATSLVRLDLDAMVDQSATVVVGSAVSQRSEQTENGLYTMTTFSVSDAVVGNSGSTVTVATPGGIRVNGKFKFAETWPGAPQFARGQEVLMFLTADDGVGPQVVGFSQGVLQVMDTAEGKAVRMPGENGEVVSLAVAKNRIRDAHTARGMGNGVSED